MEAAQNGKVSDMMKRIPSSDDMYVTIGGRVLRGSDKLSCGVSDGRTIQVTSRMRGGGRRKDNKKRSEKKQAASAKENGQMSTEGAEKRRRTSDSESRQGLDDQAT